jgi:hypothetical protein
MTNWLQSCANYSAFTQLRLLGLFFILTPEQLDLARPQQFF